MKNLLTICCLLLFIGFHMQAQGLYQAQQAYDSGDIGLAIKSIENVVYGKDKTNTEAWILMFYIFRKAETTAPYNQFPDDCLARQYEAIKALVKLPEGLQAMENQFGKEYKYIFNKFYSEFVVFANKSMKNENFNAAFKNFKRALEVYDNIYHFGLDESSLDSILVLNTGICALRAEKYVETEKYFRILADANVQLAECAIVYSWLVKYNILEKKDLVLASAILEKGLQYYPSNEEMKELKTYLEQNGR